MNLYEIMRGFVINKKYADIDKYLAYFLLVFIFLSRYQ